MFCDFDFGFVAKNLPAFLLVVFTFLYTDIFDTVGTLIGVAEKGNLLDEKGRPPKATGAFMADAVGAFMAIAMMPLTYSIANGIMFGMLSWVILKLVTGKVKDISPVMWVSVALFALYIGLKVSGLA